MILQKMQLCEANILEFDLQVFGTTDKTSDIRFVIEGPEYSISCKCLEENGTVSVQIPKLKGILEAGQYAVKLECIIDGKIFTPLSESVEFEPLIEFGVGKKKAEPVKEGVTVQLKNATPSFEDSKPSNYQLAEEEGFEIVKIKNFDVLKKDELYFGFVSEKAYLKTENGFSTLTELMEAM